MKQLSSLLFCLSIVSAGLAQVKNGESGNGNQRTIAQVRSGNPDPANDKVFQIVEKDKEGLFRYDGVGTPTEDDGVMTIVTANGKRYKRIVKDYVDVKWFGATGNGTNDDQPAIQKAIDWVIENEKTTKNVYFPPGTYKISQPLLVYKWYDKNYAFASCNLIGQDMAHWNNTAREAIIETTFNDKFAIGFQLVRSCLVKGLVIKGVFNPPYSEKNAAALAEWFTRPYATWASAYGVRDNQYSPYAGIVVDPFYYAKNVNNVPASGKYPGMESYYKSKDITQSGSSGIEVRDCRIYGFTVGFCVSPNGNTLNAENIYIENIAIEACKVAYASCQPQSKDNFIKKLISWERVHTIIDNKTYGEQLGALPYIDGMNIAGTVIEVFNCIAPRFPVSFTNIFTEGLFKVGTISSGTGAVIIKASNFECTTAGEPNKNSDSRFQPDFHIQGSGVIYEGCTFRFYDDLFNKRFSINGFNTFKGCYFDLPPLSCNMQNETLRDQTFEDCYTFTGSFGRKLYNGYSSSTNVGQIFAYGDMEISDAFYQTTGRKYIEKLSLFLKAGTLCKTFELGSIKLAVDPDTRTGTCNIGAMEPFVTTGDYFIVGNPFTVIGRVSKVDRNNKTVTLSEIPLNITSNNYYVLDSYIDMVGGSFIGDFTQNSNNITNVDFPYNNWLGNPVVGQRIRIPSDQMNLYPIITAIDYKSGSKSIVISYPSKFTRKNVTNPILSTDPSREKMEIISYVTPSDKQKPLLDFPVLITPGTKWQVRDNPLAPNGKDISYTCIKGGFISPANLNTGVTRKAEWDYDGFPSTVVTQSANSIQVQEGMLVDGFILKATAPMTLSIGNTNGGTNIASKITLQAGVSKIVDYRFFADANTSFYLNGISNGTVTVTVLQKRVQ